MEKINRKKLQENPLLINRLAQKTTKLGRVIAFLTRPQVDFIDKISKDIQFNTGRNFSRASVVRAIIEQVRKHNIADTEIASEKDLEARIADVLKRNSDEIIKAIKKDLTDEK